MAGGGFRARRQRDRPPRVCCAPRGPRAGYARRGRWLAVSAGKPRPIRSLPMGHYVRSMLLAVTTYALLACAVDSPRAQTSSQPANPTAPKVLNIVGSEPSVIGNFPGVRGGTGSHEGIANEFLTAIDPRGEVIPRLAAETISVETGTWRVNPDGTMDTIWSIRPNVKWQDGFPFTADDLLFTYTAYKDPSLPSFYGVALDLMTSAEVIDPLTFAVHWSQPYFQANLAPGLDPMPRHLLEAAYLN